MSACLAKETGMAVKGLIHYALEVPNPAVG